MVVGDASDWNARREAPFRTEHYRKCTSTHGCRQWKAPAAQAGLLWCFDEAIQYAASLLSWFVHAQVQAPNFLMTKFFDLLFSQTFFQKMDLSHRQATHLRPVRQFGGRLEKSEDFSRQMDGCGAKKGLSEQNSPGRILDMSIVKRFFLWSVCVSLAGNSLAQAPATPPGQPAAPGAPAAPGTPPAAPGAPAAPADLNMEAQAQRLQTEAFTAFGEGKFTDALAKAAEIRKLVNDKPFAQILYLEGACYFNMNDYAKAAETLQQYVDKFPDGEAIIDVRMALGRSYIQKGEADKGVAILKEVVTKSPDRKGEAGLVIANHYKKENKIDEAL